MCKSVQGVWCESVQRMAKNVRVRNMSTFCSTALHGRVCETAFIYITVFSGEGGRRSAGSCSTADKFLVLLSLQSMKGDGGGKGPHRRASAGLCAALVLPRSHPSEEQHAANAGEGGKEGRSYKWCYWQRLRADRSAASIAAVHHSCWSESESHLLPARSNSNPSLILANGSVCVISKSELNFFSK